MFKTKSKSIYNATVKPFMVLSFIWLLSMFIVPHTLMAKNGPTYKIGIVQGLDPNGDGFLSVRNRPNGKELEQIRNGKMVHIIGKKGKWYKISFYSQNAWVYGKWVKTGTITKTKRSKDAVKDDTDYSEGEGDAKFLKLYGKNESCILSFYSDGSILFGNPSDCRVETNAQGAFMVCTPHKEACKPLGEVFGLQLTELVVH